MEEFCDYPSRDYNNRYLKAKNRGSFWRERYNEREWQAKFNINTEKNGRINPS